MLEISATVLMIIIECLIVVIALSALLFFWIKRLKARQKHTDDEIETLQLNLEKEEQKSAELSGWKVKFHELKQKFNQLKNINVKFKELITSLMPEADKSTELQQLLSDAEIANKELDSCLGSLMDENKILDKKMDSYSEKITKLNKQLNDTVKKFEFDKVVAEKNRLKQKINQLEKKLTEKTEEFEKLEQEYDALYENIHKEPQSPSNSTSEPTPSS